ncbi:MAG: response regulator transcription factor [Traorella sp.]
MNKNILIAEDDIDIIELLTLYLTSNGFQVFSSENGQDALTIFKKEKIDVALVDIMMPQMNGYEFIKEVRKTSDLPIIIISAKTVDVDRVLGLDLGADVYLTKPFNPLEVVAYVKALLRRCQPDKEKIESKRITVGELEFDFEKFILYKNGKVLPMTLAELKIVSKMMKSPERVFTKAQLYECINGDIYNSDDNTMMVHISNIRSKIEDDPSRPKYIKTVRGLGYKLENKNSE